MSEAITVVEKEARHTLAVSAIVGTMKLARVMGPAYISIMGQLKKQNIECGKEDVPFTIYKNINWQGMKRKGIMAFIHMMFFQKWDMDMGIPCPESAKGEGPIRNFTIEGGKFLRTIHQGPYMKVGDTYTKLQAFAAEKGHSLKNWSVEFYLNDPREVKAAELQTEVCIPLA